MSMKNPNELHRELLGVVSLNPFAAHDSSPRQQMGSSHISQSLVVSGATERFIQTGMEREYGKYTFSIKIPGDPNGNNGVEIIKIIERYPYRVGRETIKFNPQTVVLYEDINTKEIGMLSIPKYCSYHQYFGFEYKPTPSLAEVRVGAFMAAGTILMNSPSITSNGGYKYGIECNVAYMSHPSVSEDGVMISSDVLKKFSFKTYENRSVEWGSKRFPLNLYGDADNYKPFPDIGDRIRSDGILMCLRNYNKELAVVEQSISDLMEPDFIFDKLTYAGGAGGVVVDIKIHHDSKNTASKLADTPTMDDQADKYNEARYRFYKELIDEYHRLKKQRGDNLRLTPELHRMLVEAMAVMDTDPQQIIKLYHNTPLDDYRVEFVIEYETTPTIGFKISDFHGGKGVICKIAEPHEMPVDTDGNRADIVMDALSTVGRMNIGRLYEQYFNSASRDVVKVICKILHIDKNEDDVSRKLLGLENTGSELLDRAWDYLMAYYKILSPKMYVILTDGEYVDNRTKKEYKDKRSRHLSEVVRNGIYLYMPPSNAPEPKEVVEEIERHFRPTYGPVSYVGATGVRVTTTESTRIGSVYMILLEKTADDWTAVSSGKLQHFGVLSQVTNSDKFSQPSRNQAIRALGESETRIYASYCGSDITADILDRNNSLITHKMVLESILNANIPTNIDRNVDRNINPIGHSKPLVLVKHMACTSGWSFIYKNYIPSW